MLKYSNETGKHFKTNQNLTTNWTAKPQTFTQAVPVSVFSAAVPGLPDGLAAAWNARYPRVMSDAWGEAGLKTTPHLFSQVLGCRRPLRAPTPLCEPDHQHAQRRSALCLSSWPRPNYAAQKMKRGRRSPRGSRRGLPWLGGLSRRSPRLTSPCVPSTPLASGQWAILGASGGTSAAI